jgi:outer membrane protein TolC
MPPGFLLRIQLIGIQILAKAPLFQAAALVLGLVFPLTGCAVGPDFVQPAAPGVSGYTAGRLTSTDAAAASGGASQRFANGADISGVWWRTLRSKQLDAFVSEAVANHPDLVAAQAALRQAREVAAADTSALFPSITGNSSVTREQVPAAAGGLTGPASLYTLYNTSVPVSFTPDIFGGKARGIEADRASAEYQRFQLEATYLTLTSNVVAAAISDASYAEQIRVTQELIEGQRKQVELLEQQYARSTAPTCCRRRRNWPRASRCCRRCKNRAPRAAIN